MKSSEGRRISDSGCSGSGVRIVALSNTNYGNFGVDDLDVHLLDARFPLTDTHGSERDTAVTGALSNRDMSP